MFWKNFGLLLISRVRVLSEAACSWEVNYLGTTSNKNSEFVWNVRFFKRVQAILKSKEANDVYFPVMYLINLGVFRPCLVGRHWKCNYKETVKLVTG